MSYSRVVLFVLFACSFLSPFGIEACDESVADGDAVDLEISVSQAPTNKKWSNHLKMLSLWGVVPETVSISVPNAALKRGFLGEANFVKTIQRVSKTPAGNLALRLFAHWSQLVAKEVGRESLAGTLFVHAMDREALNVSGQGGSVSLEASELSQLFRAYSFGVIPPLGNLATSPDERSLDEIVLTQLFTAIQSVSGMLSTEYGAQDLARIHVGQFTGMFGMDSVPLIQRGQTRSRLSFKMQADAAEQYHIDLISDPNTNVQAPHFLVPAIGDHLPEINYAARVRFNEKDAAGYIRLSPELGSRINLDLKLFEHFFYPLLVETGAYHAHAATIAAMTGQGTMREPVVLYSASQRNLSDDELREEAIAQAMMACAALVPRQQRALAMTALFIQLLERDEAKRFTFASYEDIARDRNLPVWLIATRALEDNYRRIWPGISRFAGRQQAPRHVIWVSVMDSRAAQARKEQWKIEDEANQRALAEDTGIIAPIDPLEN